MSGTKVSIACMLLKIRNTGIIVTWCGRSIVLITSMKRKSRPGARRRANA